MVDDNKKIRRLRCLRSVKFKEPGNIDKEKLSNKIAERWKNKIFNTGFKKIMKHD
jgi:hypothetical protein